MKILAFILSLIVPIYCYADTRYMSTTGTDSGTCGEGSPCLTLQYAMSQMSSGDTLEIADGTYEYTGSAGNDNYISDTYYPPSGPGTGSGDARFTIIKAENEGGVTFDLGSNGKQIIYLGSTEVDYLKIQGVIFTHANSTAASDARYLVQVAENASADHWYFRRCGFYRTGGGGASTNQINLNYVLFEECYFWGRGRYAINLRTPNDYGVIRRCVFRMDDQEATLGAGVIAAAIAYEYDYVEWQNNIVLDSDRDYWTTYVYPMGGLLTHFEADGDGTHYQYYRGNILLNIDVHYANNSQGNPSYGYGFEIDHDTSTNLTYENNVVWAFQGHSVGGSQNTGANIVMSNFTVGLTADPADHVGDGIRYVNGSGSYVKDSIVYSCRDDGLLQIVNNDYNCVYGNGDNFDGVTNEPEPNGVTYNPTENGLEYIVRIESSSNLKSAGESGSQIGAEVMKRYGIDGTFYGEDVTGSASTDYKDLTDVDLWPFPHEDQIKNAMKVYSSGACSGARGFCASSNQLDGETEITLTSYIWEYLGNQMPSDIYGGSTAIETTVSGASLSGVTFGGD